MKKYIINSNDSEQRLDKFIMKAVPKLPMSLLYKYLRIKRIKLNGKRCDKAYILLEGDILELYINDEYFEAQEKSKDFMCSSSNLNIIYEDLNIMIVSKPEGIDVHCSCDKNRENLINQIKLYLYNKGEYNPENENSFAPAVCNRLDRNTVGLVIAAKNAKSLREINRHIKNKDIIKKYIYISPSLPPKAFSREEAYLKKGNHNSVEISAVPTEGYKKIITEYKVLKSKNGLNLIEVSLITGRTHQIRAHMAYLGAPVLGDGKYGSISFNKRFGVYHQLLCAYSLEFRFDEDSCLNYLDSKVFKIPSIEFVNRYFNSNIGK